MFISPILVCPRRPWGVLGESCLAFRHFSSLTTHFRAGLLYAPHAPFIRRYGSHCLLRNWRFQVPKIPKNDLSQRRPAIIVCRWVSTTRRPKRFRVVSVIGNFMVFGLRLTLPHRSFVEPPASRQAVPCGRRRSRLTGKREFAPHSVRFRPLLEPVFSPQK
jgi:hypothetical protein